MSTNTHQDTTVGGTDQPQYVTVKDVAQIYRLSVATVYRLVQDGTLKAYRAGRAIRLDAAQVAAAFRS